MLNNKTDLIIQAKLKSLLSLTFANWPVGLQEVWLEIDLKQIASNSLYCVVYGEDMDPLSIFHIRTRLNAEGNIKLNTTAIENYTEKK